MQWFLDVAQGLGGWAWTIIGIESVQNFLGDVLRLEVTKMTVAFLIAARMHRRWVKKDVSDQLGKITAAIDNMAVTIATGLQTANARLGQLELGVSRVEKDVHELKEGHSKINERVEKLETKQKE